MTLEVLVVTETETLVQDDETSEVLESAAEQGPPGPGGGGGEGGSLPAGGSTGQVLAKSSDADGDANWVSNIGGNAGTATTLQTARTIDGQAFNGSENITVIAPGTAAADSKATPVDADMVPLVDSAASNVLKKLTWANLKATLKAYFDTVYGPAIPSYTVATLPNPATAGARAMAWATDLGVNGSLLMSNGSRWRPVNGDASLGSLGAPIAGITNTAVAVLQVLLPAGALTQYDKLRLTLAAFKSGGTDNCLLTVRVGATGTATDPIVTGLSALNIGSGGNVNTGVTYDLKLLSSTSLQRLGNTTAGGGGSYTGGTSAAHAAATTIDDASTTPLYVSVYVASSGATNTITVDEAQLTLVTA